MTTILLLYADCLLLELCAPEFRSDPQSAAVLASSDCTAVCAGVFAFGMVGWLVLWNCACCTPDAKQQTIGVIPNNIENVSNWVKLRGTAKVQG
jgi:hypothetical protein